METIKAEKKERKLKNEITSVDKKRISKTMKAAMKVQGAFDRDEVIKFANS